MKDGAPQLIKDGTRKHAFIAYLLVYLRRLGK